jgi:Esterase-like activity of phytase
MVSFRLVLLALVASPAAQAVSLGRRTTPVATTTCIGKTYVYDELAGFGYVPSDAKDSTKETLGGFGSAIAIDNWRKEGDHFKATFYGLPDRGWNTNGTTNTVPRVQVFELTFTPQPGATVAKPSGPNVKLDYKRTILLTGPDGTFMTGLDPNSTLTYPGFPAMPASKYTGDGFGGDGPGGKRICLDPEGLVLGDDYTFWISDEYGPFVYQFNKDGRMIQAIQPPDAFLPLRKGVVEYVLIPRVRI